MSYISTKLQGNEVLVWERHTPTERTYTIYDAPYYFYIDDEHGKYTTMYNTKTSKVSFNTSKEAYLAKQQYTEQHIRMWESDIGPDLRILSNNYYNIDAPKLNITHLDIETAYDKIKGYGSPLDPFTPMISCALYHEHTNTMIALVVPPPDSTTKWTAESLAQACDEILPVPTDEYSIKYVICDTESELLLEILSEIENSDLLSGWNSTRFDYPYMAGRIKRVLGEHYLRFLSFPEGDKTILEERLVERKTNLNKINEKNDDLEEDDLPESVVETQMVLETSGRLLADYMLIYKKYEASEKPSYKLSAISDDVLVDENDNPTLPKLEYDGSLMDLYSTNLPFFIRYNIRDVEILHGFEKKLGYIDIANTNYHLSCGQFKHVLGTLKLAELAITNYCHHVEKKVVQNNVPPPVDRSIEGALVLLPRVGLHSMVGSIDIKSLYPSVIMLLNMSTETIIGQFDEEMDACIEVSNKTETLLTLRFEDGEETTAPASTWHEIFKAKNWAISGYGTVFDQNFQGIIPAVLIDWFGKRITFQKLKKQAEKDHNYELAEYYDRLQYVYKIKLNSLYGGLSNIHFRFYDLRLGESTTGTGRMILRHQCRKANEILEGEYNIDFPMYDTTKTALKKGYPIEVALDGPKFKGEYQTKSIVYGDSVTGDTRVHIPQGNIRIDSLFVNIDYVEGEKEYCVLEDVDSLTYDKNQNKVIFKPIKYIMRHKCSKQLYRVWISDNQWLDVTEDHSLMGYINTEHQSDYNDFLVEVKPTEWNNDISSLVHLVSNIQEFELIKPIKIEELPIINDYVYDIEVEDTHMFFANDILVHNTDSSYFETGADNVDDAVLIADEIARQVNSSFPDFVQKTFLVDDNHKHLITTSREVVSDRGIFVEKKRYILHLVDVEGKSVDKLKVMGLDTKKTTLPAPVAKQLYKFIERFLKGETWEEVSISVVDYKDDLLYTSDIMSIGLPKGIKNVEKYTEEHNYNHSCRLPGHVAASLHYNKCLEIFDDRVSLPIKSGMKIKVFRLHGKYQGRFTSIAIPTDAEFIPEWFTEEFVIDRDAHVERLVDKPLLNILKAIEKSPPTQETLTTQSAWDF